jgi:hypothetical protein
VFDKDQTIVIGLPVFTRQTSASPIPQASEPRRTAAESDDGFAQPVQKGRARHTIDESDPFRE